MYLTTITIGIYRQWDRLSFMYILSLHTIQSFSNIIYPLRKSCAYKIYRLLNTPQKLLFAWYYKKYYNYRKKNKNIRQIWNLPATCDIRAVFKCCNRWSIIDTNTVIHICSQTQQTFNYLKQQNNTIYIRIQCKILLDHSVKLFVNNQINVTDLNAVTPLELTFSFKFC